MLDSDIFREIKTPMILTVILSFSNLGATVMLPWKGYKHQQRVVKHGHGSQQERVSLSYEGFPTRWLMFATIATTFFEDIPQVSIQFMSVYANYWGVETDKQVPTVQLASMVVSFFMILRQLVLKCLMKSLRETKSDLREVRPNEARRTPLSRISSPLYF